MADCGAGSAGSDRSGAGRRADSDAGDFGQSAGAWGYFYAARTATRGCVPGVDGPLSGFDPTGICGAAIAGGHGGGGLPRRVGSGVAVAAFKETASRDADGGSGHGALFFRSEHCTGSVRAVSVVETFGGESKGADYE